MRVFGGDAGDQVRGRIGSQGQECGAFRSPALDLAGSELRFIRVDHTVVLEFAEAQVQIETPFDLDDGRTQRTLDPAERTELGPVLAIYPANLTNAVVDAGLVLHLVFDSGARLNVPSIRTTSPGTFFGPGKRQIHCPPAGDGTIAVFD